MSRDNLLIGAVAKAADTKAETIRYYERIGLLPMPARTTANYRVYSGAHVHRLSFIRRARHLGFSIGQVRDLLEFSDQRATGRARRWTPSHASMGRRWIAK